MNELLLQASDIASKYCDVRTVEAAPATFARQTVVEQIIIQADPYAPRYKELYLSLSPVEVTGVTVDGVAVDLADLFIQPIGIISYLPTATERYWRAGAVIEVTMAAGYVSPVQAAEASPPTGPAMPTDIARGVIIIAQQLYGSQSREEFGLIAETDTADDLGTLSKRWSDTSRYGGIPAEAVSYLSEHVRLI